MTPIPILLRRAAVPLVIVLGAFLFLRGLVPAWTRIDTDFPNYYTAGRIVLTGGDAARLYDDAWFQEQAAALGFSQTAKFSPFPPATALLCAPLALPGPQNALRILTVLNLGALLLIIRLLARGTGTAVLPTAAFVLLTGQGLANTFRFGQLYLLLALCVTAGWSLARSGRRFTGGLLLGVFIPVKYYPAAFIPVYIARRDWRTLGGMTLGAGGVLLAGVLALGPEMHGTFLRSAAAGHLEGRLSLQDPWSHSFQSFTTLFRRLFVQDALRNPDPLLHAPFVAVLLTGIVSCVVLAVLLRSLRRADDRAWALWAVGALLVAPATATYHMVLLCLPAAILLLRADTPAPQIRRTWVLAGAYAAIGFLPMSALRMLDGGWTTPLAYPRLFLLAVLFTAGALTHLANMRRNP